MLDEYAKKFYIPSVILYEQISKNNFKILNDIIDIEEKANLVWDKIFIKDFFLKFPNEEKIISGDLVNIEAYVFLDQAEHTLFEVELFYQYDNKDHYEIIPLEFNEKYTDNVVKYNCSFRLKNSGYQNLSVRIKPKYNFKLYKERKLIKWR